MNNDKHNPYPKFLAMIATSTVVMMILMYLNTYATDHLFWSETRAYMAVLMGATMAIVMLGGIAKVFGDDGAVIDLIEAKMSVSL